MTRRFFAPERHSLAAAREICVGATSAMEAWDRLVTRSLVPASWRSDPTRVFVKNEEDEDHGEVRDPAYGPFGTCPSSIAGCILAAADVEGMLRAEAAARDLATCLAPWSAPPFKRVAWWTLSRARYDYAVHDTRPSVSYALLFALGEMSPFPESEVLRVAPPFGNAAEVARAWDSLVRRRAPLPAKAPAPVRPSGATFAEIPNPCAPLAAIEAEGYAALEYLGKDGTVILVLPRDAAE